MEDFHRKVWIVAMGHMTNVPPTVTYASVVLHETVHIALTMAALNALKVMAAGIMNTYITAQNKANYRCYLALRLARTKAIKP